MQMQQLTISGVCRDEYDAAGPIPYNITSAHIVFQLFFPLQNLAHILYTQPCTDQLLRKIKRGKTERTARVLGA